MMRDYQREFANRVRFIKEVLQKSGASGLVFGNSGGKDSALVGILCQAACANTLGIIMPCSAQRNFGLDKADGLMVAELFGIETRVIDLTAQRELALENLQKLTTLNDTAITNIAPRLRMITLYAVAASEGRLVAGTGNKSEIYMGYFTKWGDGAYDFNPIADLTVREIYEFLEYLGAPSSIVEKAPSGGLFEGQTDEAEMGVTYQAIDDYITRGRAQESDREIIERFHARSEHKRTGPTLYKG